VLYNGIIRRCKISDENAEKMPCITLWIELNVHKVVQVHCTGSVTELAKKFELSVVKDGLILINFNGKNCSVQKQDDSFYFMSFE